MRTTSKPVWNASLRAGLALTFLCLPVRPAGAQVQPQVGITNGNTGIGVFWPAADNGFFLQWTTNLAPPVSWQPYPTPPAVVGENFVVALPATNPAAFFQLGPPSAPTVTTLAATAIASDSAVLNGNVNPNGDGSTLAWFEYGTTTNYGMITAQAGPGPTSPAFSLTLPGLAPSTTYHYRIDATNTGGASSGTDATFTTGAIQPGQPLPIVATLAVTTNFFTTNANSWFFTANVDVNTGGARYTVSAYFQYGTTTNYGSVTPVGRFTSNTTAEIAEGVSDLAPATTYHYRVVVFDGGGTSIGGDLTFADPPVQ